MAPPFDRPAGFAPTQRHRTMTVDENIRLHSGAYVSRYERHSMARITRLASKMELRVDEDLADFACGNAMLLEATHDRVRHYHGIDFSADFIQASERRARELG